MDDNYRVTGFQPSQDVIKYILIMILIEFIEELITSGIIFRLVEKWAGSIIALAVVTVEGGLCSSLRMELHHGGNL